MTSIRPATPRDTDAIRRMLEESELPTDGIADILATRPTDFFVAESERALVGVAGLEICGNDALLRSVAVHPEWRSTGVGRDLVHRAVEHAEARGLRALYLLTLTAERYFPRFGFERVERASVPPAIAETAEFKAACPESAVTMQKVL